MPTSRNWINQRSFLIGTYNNEVNNWFKDIEGQALDNSDPRLQSKMSCLIEPNDSQNMALIKINTFRYTVQQVHLRPDVYGVEAERYQQETYLRPQVSLYFTQDASAVTPGRRRVEGQLTFRLMTETAATMTKEKAQPIAEKIRDLFVLPSKFVWKKGKMKLMYKQPEYGLNLRIMCLNKEEGLIVINKMLELVEGEYNQDLLKVSNPERESETNPQGTPLIYGKPRKQKRWRPTANVRFRYAMLIIEGLNYNISLVDTTHKYFKSLVFVT